MTPGCTPARERRETTGYESARERERRETKGYDLVREREARDIRLRARERDREARDKRLRSCEEQRRKTTGYEPFEISRFSHTCQRQDCQKQVSKFISV